MLIREVTNPLHGHLCVLNLPKAVASWETLLNISSFPRISLHLLPFIILKRPVIKKQMHLTFLLYIMGDEINCL